jgi:ADP-ribose pyrophosphatase
MADNSSLMKRKEKRLVWSGRSWQLYVETLEVGNGRLIERGQINHPGAVVLVPILIQSNDPQIVMIHQFRHALNETILELPAGTREREEAWLDCAQRELQEEAGYRADSFTELRQLWSTPGISNERMVIYLAADLHTDPLPVDVDEQIEVQPYRLSVLLEMIRNGRILDAKTIIGLWQTAVHFQIPL